MSHRVHIDNSVKLIGKLLFGINKGPEVLNAVRPTGQPLVDDWDCLKNMVYCLYNNLEQTTAQPSIISNYVLIQYKCCISEVILCIQQVRSFEARCGSLSQYGMKHMRSFANLCNAGISKEQMAEASAQACVSVPSGPWSSLHKGFTAWWFGSMFLPPLFISSMFKWVGQRQVICKYIYMPSCKGKKKRHIVEICNRSTALVMVLKNHVFIRKKALWYWQKNQQNLKCNLICDCLCIFIFILWEKFHMNSKTQPP